MMENHAGAFFSDEDVARFAKGRVFLARSRPDNADGAPNTFGPVHILPTADQHRRMREEEERSESHRIVTGGESCVTLESLPFVCDDSSADRKNSVREKRSSTLLLDACFRGRKCGSDDKSGEHSEKCGGDATSEGGFGDALITTQNIDDEQVDQEGAALWVRRKKVKVSHTYEASQMVAPEKNKGGGSGWLDEKDDVRVNNGAMTRESCPSYKKNNYDLYSEQSESDEDGGEPSEEETSEEAKVYSRKIKSSLGHENMECPKNREGDAASEGGLSVPLIHVPNENKKYNWEGVAFVDGRKKAKVSGANETKQMVAPDKNEDDSSGWLSKKRDMQASSVAMTNESCISRKKNRHGLYSEQSETKEDEGESGEDGISDELISFSEDDDDEFGLRANDGNIDGKPRTPNEREAPSTTSGKNRTLITSSEAVGSSIIKSTPGDSGWHRRRSESEVVLSRIKRDKQRSLLKRPRGRRRTTDAAATVNSPEDGRTRQRTEDEVEEGPRRTTLRFAAAPRAVNKRKKQMSLMSMFKK
mmetsp:Transcript_50712/g.108066  ORF Transcript_50712/g.108066 Transcript_50712/m.108066 type:complete len:531 (+) Transcript_50712:354-1946(+)